MKKILAYIVALGLVAGTATLARGVEREPSGPQRMPKEPVLAMPDLTITSAAAAAKCAGGGKWTVTVIATLKNQGLSDADVSKSPWGIVVEAKPWWTSGGSPGQYVKPQTGVGQKLLKAGQSWTVTLDITNITYPTYPQGNPDNIQTQLGIEVIADPLNLVPEKDENNNRKLTYVTVKKSDCK